MRTIMLLTIFSAALILACSEPTMKDASCESYGTMPDYETMMRYPERFGGECYRFIGYVTDVNYDDVIMNVWVDTSHYPTFEDRRVAIFGAPDCLQSTGRILVGDQVNLGAMLADDPLQFESVAAGFLEVPLAFCSKKTGN